MEMGEPHQGERDQDQHHVEGPLDRLTSRLEDHARHQTTGRRGDPCQDRVGVGGVTCVEVEESQRTSRYERGRQQGGKSHQRADGALQVIADIDGKTHHISTGKELDQPQAGHELLVAQPSLLGDHHPPDVGGDAASEARETDEAEETGDLQKGYLDPQRSGRGGTRHLLPVRMRGFPRHCCSLARLAPWRRASPCRPGYLHR